MRSNSSGSNNVAVGLAAGIAITTGSSNTLLGSRTNTSSASANNRTIGFQAKGQADNSVTLVMHL